MKYAIFGVKSENARISEIPPTIY